MKARHLSILIFVSGLACAPVLSFADDAPSGFFVNGGVGTAHVDARAFPDDPSNQLKDDSTAYDFNVGYRWGWFGIELGYADPRNFQKTRTEILEPLGPNQTYVDRGHVHGVTAGINVHYDLTPQWYVTARGGAFHWQGDETFFIGFNDLTTDAPITSTNGGSHTDWYAGVGVGYDFTQHFGIGVAYDRYKAVLRNEGIDLTSRVASVTAEYRF